MTILNLDKKLQKKILDETQVLLETGKYTISQKVQIESPSTLNGINLAFTTKIGAFSHINEGGFIKNCTIFFSLAFLFRIANILYSNNISILSYYSKFL